MDNPQSVQPAPIPVTVSIAKTQAVNGANVVDLIVLRLDSATGSAVYFLPMENAREVARMLTEASTGLAMPQPSLAAQLAAGAALHGTAFGKKGRQ